MLMIRLKRVGRKHDPSFRVIVIDKRKAAQAGNYIEMLGSYNPQQKNLQLKEDRIKYWLSVGAKTSGTVHNFLVSKKIIEGPKVRVLPRQKKKEETEKTPPETENKVGEKTEAKIEEPVAPAPEPEVKTEPPVETSADKKE